MTDTCVVLCTCPPDQAPNIAGALVAEQLAACVNTISSVVSTYRWQGEVQTDDEALLIIKSTTAAFSRLSERLIDLHPYDVPEIIRLDIADGHPRYLNWLVAGVL